jgi:hypothetical protein
MGRLILFPGNTFFPIRKIGQKIRLELHRLITIPFNIIKSKYTFIEIYLSTKKFLLKQVPFQCHDPLLGHSKMLLTKGSLFLPVDYAPF